MRTTLLATAATAAALALAVPGTATAASGLQAECTPTILPGAKGTSYTVPFVATAYTTDADVIATFVSCTIRTQGQVWGHAGQALPGPASVAAGTASVPVTTISVVCVNAFEVFSDLSSYALPERCLPLIAYPAP